jgi:hypothetical protein
MTVTVRHLHRQAERIGAFVRIGNSGHRRLETLHCADRLRVRAGGGRTGRLHIPGLDTMTKVVEATLCSKCAWVDAAADELS